MSDHEVRHVRIRPPVETRPRRSRRRMIPGVLVAVDAPALAAQPWVVDAVDINADGMGLVLPPEIVAGTEVFLTFRLDADTELARVPATVVHQESQVGGVIFDAWSPAERLALLEHLVRFYESEQPSGSGSE
jgi:hypothetical protein